MSRDLSMTTGDMRLLGSREDPAINVAKKLPPAAFFGTLWIALTNAKKRCLA